jgi:drug/metabolite transporter (DMT)-like permease
MLNDLEKTMKLQPNGNVANALRQAVMGVFGSQVTLVLIITILASLFLNLEQHDRGWWIWLAGISVGLFMIVSAVALKELSQKSFVPALRAAILLGAITSLPAVFAALLFILEGASFGAWAMVFVTTQTLVFAIAQVSLLGNNIEAPLESNKQAELEIVERFQGFGGLDFGNQTSDQDK